MIAYELAVGELPFNTKSINEVMDKIVPDIDLSRWSPSFNMFIKRCTNKNSARRATIDQILQDPFLQEAAQLSQNWIDEYDQLLTALPR